MTFFLLFILDFAASFSAPLDDVAAAARFNDIVPKTIPSIDLQSELFVNFSQPAGNYTNCGTLYNFPAMMFSLNDTGITDVTPWYARSYRPTPAGGPDDYFQYVPEIVWEASNTTMYTLMVVDPLFIINASHPYGPYVQHYMVINIMGNNISTGDVINRYLGPAPTDPQPHKYVFVLYAQSGMLNLTANQTADIQGRVNFNVTTFLSQHNLTSAVGINWLYAKGDSWAPVEQDALKFSKLDCFVPVEQAARGNGIVPSIVPNLNLTTRLTVSYNQPKGNFTNCNQVHVNDAIFFDLNDTVIGGIMQTPWNARSYRPNGTGTADYFMYQPYVTWSVADNSSLYTLLMVDAGRSVNSTFSAPFVAHWVVVNIPGNNISLGDLVNPLLGPISTDPESHLYSYMLYLQPGNLTLSPDERKAIEARNQFDLSNFVANHSLGFPAGVNWLYASSDAWTPVVQDALNISKLNCLGPVEDAARKNDIVPLIVPAVNLTTRLTVNFVQPEGNYTNCGMLHANGNASFSLNDTGITTQTPWNTRSYRPTGMGKLDYFQYVPDVTWTAEDATLYTLLVVDPLFILNATDNSTDKWGPYVAHYVVLNIVGNNISTGETINKFLGPAPIGLDPHKYVFLVYPQPGNITLDVNETAFINGRINFNLTTFLAKHNYTSAAGINWVYASGDDWSPVEQDALGFSVLDCFGAVEDAAKKNGIVPAVIPAINLTTRLSVRFVQPAGSYLSCGTEYAADMANFTLDDTSITNSTPWNMRSYRPSDLYSYQPEVHWTTTPDALYTLMMVDPVFVVNQSHPWGPYVQHWMVVNIPANDTSKGEVVNPFLGPAPYEINTFHKYTYVLYRQPGLLNLTADEKALILKRLNFNLPAFVGAHNLTAASGINWGYAMVDPWALVQLDDLDWLAQDCFSTVESTANALSIVPSIIPALALDTQLRVSFDQPADSFVNCDTKYNKPAFNMSLSDSNVSLVYQMPWDLRSYRPGPNKSLDIMSYTPAITWTAPPGLMSLYTLLVVDPVYILNAQDPAGPFINHFMVVNINNTDLKTGKVINHYFGPAPLDPLYHKYLFLLYRQRSLLNLTNAQISKYQMRTNFSLFDFVGTHDLEKPVGVNWVFAQADLWSPVALDYIGFKPLNCPAAPTPASNTNWVHLTPGAFAAIAVIGSLLIVILGAYAYYLRSANKRKVGTGYNPLPGDGGRKPSVNREK